MFIQIRGTFGSGKTAIMRNIIAHLEKDGAVMEVMPDEKGRTYAQRYSRQGMNEVIIIGKYGLTPTGGADLLSGKGTIDKLENFILEQAPKSHVLMEGSIVTCTRFIKAGSKLNEMGVKAAYFDLSTPLDECIKRVDDRRLASWVRKGKSGEPKPQNLKGIAALHKNCERLHKKTEEAALPCAYINSELPILKLLK